MQFLTPLFLAGLAAIAVPLWFHLIRKEQTTRVPFSSLMYVPLKEMQMVRRQRLRQWPLFLLRLLLIALVVLALSRPYWKGFSGGWVSSSLARVVLLDNSFSMRAPGRWDAARRMAEREITSAPAGSELTLALVSDRVSVLSEPGEPAEGIASKLRNAEPTWRATRLDQGLQIGGDLLRQSRMGTREIVLVSDFQKTGLHASSWSIPEGVGLRVLSVPEAGANLFIEDVQVPVPGADRAPSGSILARVRNSGITAATEIPVELRVSDQTVERKNVTIEADGAASVEFKVPELKDESMARTSVRLDVADTLPDDNQFFFTLRRQQKIQVLLSASGPAQLFLSEAIGSPGSPWDLRTALGPDSIKQAKVAILHDPGEIPGYLTSWVQDGGGLLVFSGFRSGETLNSALLPVTVQGNKILRRERDEPLVFADIQWQHPVFQIFGDQQKRYFSIIHFFGHTGAEVSPQAKVLARFNSESPALVEGSLGRGRVLWFASTASNEWNDFALRPAFLPFVQQMIGYLAGVQGQPSQLRVGDRLDLAAWGGRDVVAIDPGSRRLTVPEDPPLLDLESPGFYELRFNRRTDYVAVNVPASESNLETEAVREIQGQAGRARVAAAEVSAGMVERRQSWWRILLLVAVVLIVVEWVVADLHYGSRSGSILSRTGS